MKQFSFGLLAISTNLLSGPCTWGPGNANCKKGEVKDFQGSGIVTINGTNFLDTVKIYGQMNAKNCKFNKLQINGSSDIYNCEFYGPTYIYGYTNISSSKSHKSIQIFSNKSKFSNSDIQKISIKYSTTPLLFLENTTIHGDINFNGAYGKVYCQANCNIHGDIINGKLTKTGV